MSNSVSLADLRKDYSLKELDINTIQQNPFEQFSIWFDEAVQAQVPEPNAMFLATASTSGKPSGRIVLLKGIENNKLIFFTNYKSRKGQEIANNAQACLTFFWAELERQVRIEGNLEKISEDKSKEYFVSRPRLSQIGAIASPQSHKIESREWLENRFAQLTQEFENQDIPKPEHWGGYALSVDYFEFWQGRRSRLHDRLIYEKAENSWQISRLAP